MRVLYSDLNELKTGEELSVLRIVVGEENTSVKANIELDLNPIIDKFIANYIFREGEYGLVFELKLALNENGLCAKTFLNENFGFDGAPDEVNELLHKIGDKFAEIEQVLSGEPLFEEAEFHLIFKKDNEKYVYDDFVRTDADISKQKELVNLLKDTYVFNEVTNFANLILKNEYAGVMKFKTDGLTLKELEYAELTII